MASGASETGRLLGEEALLNGWNEPAAEERLSRMVGTIEDEKRLSRKGIVSSPTAELFWLSRSGVGAGGVNEGAPCSGVMSSWKDSCRLSRIVIISGKMEELLLSDGFRSGFVGASLDDERSLPRLLDGSGTISGLRADRLELAWLSLRFCCILILPMNGIS